jgi:beta-glucanase (GH16 family)
MPRGSVGTVISSTAYMWYGNVKARLKTSRGRGVVSAFILFSDIQDEIDYEWVGVDLETAQTNFYFQGVPNCKFLLLPSLVNDDANRLLSCRRKFC